MFKLMLYLCIALLCTASAYVIYVSGDTQFFEVPASMNLEMILGIHALVLIAVVLLIVGLIKKWIGRAIGIGLLIAVFCFEGTFLNLNLSGKIWDIAEDSPKDMLEYIQQLID